MMKKQRSKNKYSTPNNMKKLTFLLSIVILLAAVQCGKKDASPVSEIVTLMDNATKKTEQINSIAELSNVNSIVSQEDVWKIIRDNSDYQLTDGDKDKLKKSFNKLVKTAYEKSAEFVPDENLKKAFKSQLDLMMEAIDRNIDEASTLGEIRSFN